jgi:hypothetical protein
MLYVLLPLHGDCRCQVAPTGFHFFHEIDHQQPARSEQASSKAARLGASSTGRCTAKPFSDRVSPFSFAPQASHRAGGPPLVTPSAALPSRVSLSPGPGGITLAGRVTPPLQRPEARQASTSRLRPLKIGWIRCV